MKLRFVVPCLILALTALSAGAQVGLYVNPVGIHVSNSSTDSGPFAFLGENASSRTFYGVNIGGYDSFFHGEKIDAGVDIRDSYTKGNNASLNSFLIGARVVGKLANPAFKPYLQLSAGVGTTKPPTSVVHISRGTFDVFAGLDYSLAKHVDFRAVELGYGTLSTVNSSNFNSGTSYPSSTLFSISTGLVFTIR
jgi:hypothetical protein